MVTFLLHTLVCSHFRVSSFRSSRGEPLLTPSLNLGSAYDTHVTTLLRLPGA